MQGSNNIIQYTDNLYLARKEYSNDTDIQKELNAVFNRLITLNVSEARLLLEWISSN